MFDYKRDILTGFEEISSISKEDYSIREINYESPYKGKVPSYLITPHTLGSYPAVIFLHPGHGNRETFLAEAELLASKGFVSLLISAPFLRKEKTNDLLEKQRLTKTIEELVDIEQYIQTVMDVRRGIDLLCDLEYVDENRIAYVGHGFGATWGGVLAGIENRIQAFVLIAGYAKVSVWQLLSEHPTAALIRTFLPLERFDYFISNLQRLNAVQYIKHAAPASLFFQFANNDEYVNREQAEWYFSAASAPKRISWYDTDHLFTNGENALHDRLEWIIDQIGTGTGTFSTLLTKKL